jgi:hypothetical protein
METKRVALVLAIEAAEIEFERAMNRVRNAVYDNQPADGMLAEAERLGAMCARLNHQMADLAAIAIAKHENLIEAAKLDLDAT